MVTTLEISINPSRKFFIDREKTTMLAELREYQPLPTTLNDFIFLIFFRYKTNNLMFCNNVTRTVGDNNKQGRRGALAGRDSETSSRCDGGCKSLMGP